MELYVTTFCRAAIGFVFLYSAAMKIGSISDLEETIESVELVPSSLIRPAAVLALGGEFAIGGAMLFGRQLLQPGFALTSLWLTGFTGFLLYMIVRRVRASCNCFGNDDEPVSVIHIVRNAGLIVISGIGWFLAAPVDEFSAETIAIVSLMSLFAVATMLLWTNLPSVTREAQALITGTGR